MIGLGGNVGDVIANMAGALHLFHENAECSVVKVSAVYRTPPWGIEDQDWFHNACAELETSLQPIELLDECLRIERIFKRIREIRWGPRTLDLDVLVYADVELKTERLTVPHPRMHERAFVMKPLNDIAPETEFHGKKPADWLVGLDDVKQLEEMPLRGDWWLK